MGRGEGFLALSKAPFWYRIVCCQRLTVSILAVRRRAQSVPTHPPPACDLVLTKLYTTIISDFCKKKVSVGFASAFASLPHKRDALESSRVAIGSGRRTEHMGPRGRAKPPLRLALPFVI